jgi:hypothetical protein
MAAALAAALTGVETTFAADVGMVGALIAFFIACEWSDRAAVYGTFMFAAGAILLRRPRSHRGFPR